MIRLTLTIFAAMTATLAFTGCEQAPDEAAIVTDPMLAEQREEAAAPLEPGDLQPVAGETIPPADQPEMVQPAVAVLSVDADCDEVAVFFETDAAVLGPEDAQKLDRLAACLEGTPEQEQVEITGRADPRASEPYNERLSRERARTVAEYLNEQGISEERFEIRAMGEQGVIEGMPFLWPAQRQVMVEPVEPGGEQQQGPPQAWQQPAQQERAQQEQQEERRGEPAAGVEP